MEITEQIEKFHEFFEIVYSEQLHTAISKGEKQLVVNFSDLSKYNLELAQDVLENPEDVVRASEIAIEQFDFPGSKEFKIRFKNLPKTQEIMIRDIRAIHLSRLIQISGIIRQKTPVRPQVTSARFECPACGNTLTVLQLDTKFREPTKCGCGRKGRFRLLSKEMIDAQKIVIEEAPEDIDGSEQPKRIDVFSKRRISKSIIGKKDKSRK
jgi:replicative DNA helicase Mcm